MDPKTPVQCDNRQPSKQMITNDSLHLPCHPSIESVDTINSIDCIKTLHEQQENEEFSDYPVDDVDIYHAMDTIEYELNAHNYANNETRVSPTNDAKKLRQ